MKKVPSEKETKEFENKEKEFYTLFPDSPRAVEIERLNLILKREYAIDILTGAKKFEWRNVSDYYIKRLCAKGYFEWAEKHVDNPKYQELVPYADYINDVRTIHFHDYNNEWFIDVECEGVYEVYATEENAKFFREELNCHDLDEEAAWCAEHCAEGEETLLFALELGNVIDTNLDDLPEDRKKNKK